MSLERTKSSVYWKNDTFKSLDEEARKDNNTRNRMAEVLIEEALTNRDEQSKAHNK